MAIATIAALLSQPYDCLIIVHPNINILVNMASEIKGVCFAQLNVSKELSTSLLAVSANERSHFSQKWLLETFSRFHIKDFFQQDDEAENLPLNFVPAAIQALRGIQAVTLSANSLLQALKVGGLPCAREELQNRFKQFLDQQMRGHDTGNTRLTLDQ